MLNIIMHKLYENDTYIDYEIESEIPVGTFLDKKGEERVKIGIGYAYCRFNKITEEFILDDIKTNHYFLKNNYSIIKAQYKLIKIKRDKIPFPMLIQVASG